MTRLSVFACVWSAAALPCLAQQAMVVVSHNDPDGLITPGQSVQITTTVSWQGATFLEEIRGSVRAGPDIGVASSNVFPHATYASVPLTTIVDPGEAMGGSVNNMHLFAAAAVWVATFSQAAPWQFRLGFDVLRFDWTAPATPGVVEFDFSPDQILPQPTFLGPSVSPFTLPTTYFGTSLTIIPAPASAAVLAIAGAALGRRRRGW